MNREEIINKRIKEYLEKNIDLYDKYDQFFLECLDIKTIRNYKNNMPDLYRQVLEEIGYYDENTEKSGYNAFIKILDNEFGIDKNIIEIAGGVVPTLGHRIFLKQSSGTITIYDPRLSNYYKENNRFILKKEKFKRNTDTSKADILIGFMPCVATQAILENALDNKKDFLIAMCEGGPHGDEFDFYEDADEWTEAMLCLAERGLEKNDMGELKVLYFDKYNSPYPLIYNKRKQ